MNAEPFVGSTGSDGLSCRVLYGRNFPWIAVSFIIRTRMSVFYLVLKCYTPSILLIPLLVSIRFCVVVHFKFWLRLFLEERKWQERGSSTAPMTRLRTSTRWRERRTSMKRFASWTKRFKRSKAVYSLPLSSIALGDHKDIKKLDELLTKEKEDKKLIAASEYQLRKEVAENMYNSLLLAADRIYAVCCFMRKEGMDCNQ